MTSDRYNNLMASCIEPLTAEELSEGWHFCPEWDGLLVSPEMEGEWGGDKVTCRCGWPAEGAE